MKMTLRKIRKTYIFKIQRKPSIFSKDSALSQGNFFMNTQPDFEELLKLLEGFRIWRILKNLKNPEKTRYIFGASIIMIKP
ncbi:MAG: hypothetical protein DRP60_12360 [Spirochaetes bacterium]|nr:MAG: hypothetical protein DRP60_12360 [Spirochaetota bacterium]